MRYHHLMASETEELRSELVALRAQVSATMGYVHEMYLTGGSDKPEPTDPMLALVVGLFKARCSDRDYLVQKLQEAVEGVTR